MSTPSLTVVGAGLSGLTAARTLSDRGWAVQVLEKARGPGGRTATRRSGDDLRFDHGAQYFTVRDPRFEVATQDWARRGVVARWSGRIAVWAEHTLTPKRNGPPRWVGVPGMNAMASDLARGLDLRTQTAAARVEGDSNGARVLDEAGRVLAASDAVLVTAPPVQAAALTTASSGSPHPALATVMVPCWAVMLAFDAPVPLAFDGVFVNEGPLSWICRNGSKPGRPPREAWVLHAGPQWSERHLEADEDSVISALWTAFRAISQTEMEPSFARAHRWRYSAPSDAAAAPPALWSPATRIGFTGDYLSGGRVEGAYLSGLAFAEAVLDG
ncbi:MAG: NAD(P)/FAD-dependent oxidoreductase [Myxococcota bacterium]